MIFTLLFFLLYVETSQRASFQRSEITVTAATIIELEVNDATDNLDVNDKLDEIDNETDDTTKELIRSKAKFFF